MKKFFSLFALIALIATTFANASTHPVEPAPVLVDLEVTQVEKHGYFLTEKGFGAVSTYVVGIPVTISTGDACTEFVGQESHEVLRATQIIAKGSTSPIYDACIAVMPAPVHTLLTVEMPGLVDFDGKVRKYVRLSNATYVVSLDPSNFSVAVDEAIVLH